MAQTSVPNTLIVDAARASTHGPTAVKAAANGRRSKGAREQAAAVVQPTMTEYKLYGDLAIYSGTAHQDLARKVADYLDVPLGGADVFQFANTNTFVRLHESVRGKDVFLIQPTCPPVNDNLMELLIFIDTLRRELPDASLRSCPTMGMAVPTRRISHGFRSQPGWWPTWSQRPGPTDF